MSLTEKEKQIVEFGQAQNKTPTEIMSALKKFRSQSKTKTGGLSEVFSDISEGTKSIVSRFRETGENIVETATDSELSLGEKARGIGAEAFRGGARAIGEAGITAGKAVLPKNVEENIADVAGGVVEKVVNTEGVQTLLEKYNSLDDDTKREVDNALGFAEGLTAIIGGGAVSKVGKESLRKFNTVAGKTIEALGDITSVGREGIEQAVSKSINPASIMQRVARISKSKQANFEKMANQSVGEYLVDRGIFGDVDELTTQLYKRFNNSKSEVDDAIAKIGGTYKPKVIETAIDELFKRESRISSPGALSKDFARVRELKNKYEKSGLSMSEINEVKRLYERNVRLDFLKENKPESVARANSVDDGIRNWQFDTIADVQNKDGLVFSNIRELNKETRLARQLLDDLGKEYAGSAGNNAITLTDWIILAGGDPTAVGGFLAKKAFSSKGFMSKVSEKLSGTPKIGEPTAQFTEPKIDSYLDFIKSIEGRATQQ